MLETIITEAFFLSEFASTNIHDSACHETTPGKGETISLTPHGGKLFWTKNLWRGYSKWEN